MTRAVNGFSARAIQFASTLRRPVVRAFAVGGGMSAVRSSMFDRNPGTTSGPRWRQLPRFRRYVVADRNLRGSIGSEERLHAVIVGLQDRIKLVIMATRATHG